ncbi:Lnb N-terminal periplasmic domain-containing protein [Thiocapsa bogorovii]|uniref:Lnb N-terminal periplasmic domain-containing protein n=1 Tax=Thiocapsa bogorovii TaxID=521689 RepID=UPI001E308DCA|nr:DUF4105 domain-containing protein [Thiocapsa bogorovii]UHD18037.1 DUF4105 domain-containing protein [Thiocapsa bogorovii]
MILSRINRLVLRIAISLALAIAILWAGAALWIDGPESPVLAGTLAGGLVLLAGLSALMVRPWRRAVVAVFVPFAIVLGWWLTLAPSNQRDWQPDVARLPTATVDGSILTLHNVRNFAYRGDQAFTERWETRTYDLDTLVGFDLFISFWGPTAYGHTIASWEFADGRQLAVSIETRKEIGEEYSALRGFFRQYELYYVVADERDVIGVRANQRGETVYLYRLGGAPSTARALLLDYVKEINAISERPRWYNALTHNCTTTIWHHTKAIGIGPTIDWRLLANGYVVDLAYDRGTVDTGLGLDELKRRSDITARARTTGDPEAFSRAIREGLPPRPDHGAASAVPPAR